MAMADEHDLAPAAAAASADPSLDADLDAPPAAGGPELPPGREVHLPGRGTAFVRELAGPPGAPTLVLLHGWTATADLNWFTSFKALGERYRVISLDHRGHGRGIRTDARFRLADCADDVAALAEELELEQVVPVGYSMGGPVAQLVAHRHPDLVAGLVLCATTASFTGTRQARIFTSVMTGAGWLTRWAPERARDRITDRLVAARVDDSPLRHWADQELRRNDVRMLAEAGASLGRYCARDWLGTIEVPAAVVVTLRDRLIAPHRQLELADLLADGTTHLVDGEHSACVLQADAFVEGLLDALDSVTTRLA